MPSLQAIPLLFGILVGLVVGLIVFGLARQYSHAPRSYGSTASSGNRDNLLIALLALACFALGVFVTYSLVLLWGGG